LSGSKIAIKGENQITLSSASTFLNSQCVRTTVKSLNTDPFAHFLFVLAYIPTLKVSRVHGLHYAEESLHGLHYAEESLYGLKAGRFGTILAKLASFILLMRRMMHGYIRRNTTSHLPFPRQLNLTRASISLNAALG
jgi:hypothetical protein